MNFKIKLRLVGLGLSLGLLGALIVWVTLASQRQAEDARTQLGDVDTESMRIADRFKDKLRYANDRMRLYSTSRDPAHWQEFLKAGDELKAWIQTQPPKMAPGLEQEMLKQIRRPTPHTCGRPGTCMTGWRPPAKPAPRWRNTMGSVSNRGAFTTWAWTWPGSITTRATRSWRRQTAL